jgi:hypothetical protein
VLSSSSSSSSTSSKMNDISYILASKLHLCIRCTCF